MTIAAWFKAHGSKNSSTIVTPISNSREKYVSIKIYSCLLRHDQQADGRKRIE